MRAFFVGLVCACLIGLCLASVTWFLRADPMPIRGPAVFSMIVFLVLGLFSLLPDVDCPPLKKKSRSF